MKTYEVFLQNGTWILINADDATATETRITFITGRCVTAEFFVSSVAGYREATTKPKPSREDVPAPMNRA